MDAFKKTRTTLVGVLALAAFALLLTACGSDGSGNTGAGGGGLYGGGGGPSATGSPPMDMSPAPGASDGAVVTGEDEVTVDIAGFAFSPRNLKVSVGTTVTWVNRDSVPHDVVSTGTDDVDAQRTDLFASDTLSGGDSFSHTFTEEGEFPYMCSIHASMASMHAVVEVE